MDPILPNGAKPGDLPWLKPRMPDQWQLIETAPLDQILEGTDGYVGSLFVLEEVDGVKRVMIPIPRAGSYVRIGLEAKAGWTPKLWRRPKYLAPSDF